MKTAINHIYKKSLFVFMLLACSSFYMNAQVMNSFTPRLNETMQGDFTTIANNVLSRHAVNPYTGEAGNHDFTNNVYVDIDNDATTFNSSSANLTNPEPNIDCLNIYKAYLYWAAADREQSDGSDNQPNWNYNDVKLRLPGETNYTTVTADEVLFRGRDTHFV
ncbi:MAG: hypothetical protein KJO41_07015, partial [Bacteroidia bacterium]|nr:hypothetical protein [Bacteroidia bacterium]MBT8278734.1 hypothetical protein [Bacteroidia bacterium]NND26777.1 hypothetical protein [Flavobacteriaceae bacterium]NNK60515.1 hypothetical protein [Flavobacteriaceae bacterium]NNL32009.1 hypothetical protein [Flavobacteriaceae bacterium]